MGFKTDANTSPIPACFFFSGQIEIAKDKINTTCSENMIYFMRTLIAI